MRMKAAPTDKERPYMAFLCGSADRCLFVFAVLPRALLVGYRAGRFARRLAAGLAFAARGVFACFDAGFLNGLHMFHSCSSESF